MIKNQNGDTIVEVLLAMAIVGLVLGAAFGIANRSVATGRQAQERTEALKIAESQLELVKTFAADPTEPLITNNGPNFCMIDTPTPTYSRPAGNAECRMQDGRGGAGLYTIEIDKPDPSDPESAYAIKVTWERLGANGAPADIEDSVTLYYKLGAL